MRRTSRPFTAVASLALLGLAVPHPADAGPVAVRDLAITKIVAPPRVTLTAKKPRRVELIKVQIQNRGPEPEVIADEATLAALVALEVSSLGTCPDPSIFLSEARPQVDLPATIKSKKKFSVVFEVAFDCANDPAKTTKGVAHDDFAISATVDRSAIDGSPDVHPSDDVCPRSVTPPYEIDPNPNGKIKDKGCGDKKADKTFGDPILLDVYEKSVPPPI